MPSPAVSKHGRLWIIYKLVSIVKRISLKCYARKNLAPYPHGPSLKHQLYPILSTWEKKNASEKEQSACIRFNDYEFMHIIILLV